MVVEAFSVASIVNASGSLQYKDITEHRNYDEYNKIDCGTLLDHIEVCFFYLYLYYTLLLKVNDYTLSELRCIACNVPPKHVPVSLSLEDLLEYQSVAIAN